MTKEEEEALVELDNAKKKRMEAEEVERKLAKDFFALQERRREEEQKIKALEKKKEKERQKKFLPEIEAEKKHKEFIRMHAEAKEMFSIAAEAANKAKTCFDKYGP